MALSQEQKVEKTIQKFAPPTYIPWNLTQKMIQQLYERVEEWTKEGQPINSMSHQSMCQIYAATLRSYGDDVQRLKKRISVEKSKKDGRLVYNIKGDQGGQAMVLGELLLNFGTAGVTLSKHGKMTQKTAEDFKNQQFSRTFCINKQCGIDYKCSNPNTDILGVRVHDSGDMCACDPNITKAVKELDSFDPQSLKNAQYTKREVFGKSLELLLNK